MFKKELYSVLVYDSEDYGDSMETKINKKLEKVQNTYIIHQVVSIRQGGFTTLVTLLVSKKDDYNGNE